jgi:hypothetical protein
LTPAMQMPPGSPPPSPIGAPAAGSAAGAAPGSPASAAPAAGVTIQNALDAFKNVQLAGQAFLVGEIAATGSTADAVEIAITDPADKQPLSAAATFPVIFHTVAGEPSEQHVEITPSG